MTQVLRVGTDCSGIEAPIQALDLLGLSYRHVFSSELDKYCIQSIKANYEPELLYGDPEGPYPDGDITKRDHSTLPDIDLYICGFPCQPFSSAGRRKGLDDHRGNVFWSCLDVIKVKQPKYFILENVKGLLHHDKGRTWSIIWEELQSLEEYGYVVKWSLLNTRDYGIPQNRERIYIIGTKECSFDCPEPVIMDDIKLYVDWNDKKKYITTKRHENYIQNFLPNIFIELAYVGYNNNPDPKYCPCITSCSKLWCIPLHRYADINELLQLQGFDPKSFKQVVSKTQLVKQIGNSMSVNVLCAILANLIDV